MGLGIGGDLPPEERLVLQLLLFSAAPEFMFGLPHDCRYFLQLHFLKSVGGRLFLVLFGLE